MLQIAPGARAVIRDEEWLVRRVDPTADGGQLITCDGVSELVRGRSTLFLTQLEDEIQVLDPADTQLVTDDSPTFSAALLYLESHYRRSVANDQRIHLGHRGVMNLMPYQLEPALQALHQPRARILIADAVGLGKTLEAGILATELIARGRGKRILVVTTKAMLQQFQKEWWSRFTIPLVRLDSVGLARVRNRIPANHNPFNYFDCSIISVDTLKSNLEYRNYLENAWWDMIVIDECHNVAARSGENTLSRRARLARLLATRSDTLILLSATPHDGSARSFASLMSLLDPTAIPDPDEYTPADFRDKGLVIRRFRKDIRDQMADQSPVRATSSLRVQASPAEEAAYEALLAVPFTQRGQYQPGRQAQLQRVGLQKTLFSSPAAAVQSTQRRIETLQARASCTADESAEIQALQVLLARLQVLANPAGTAAFSKYQGLLAELRSPGFDWNPQAADDRLVIFSERLETLAWLQRQLGADLNLAPQQIAVLHGQMADTEQQAVVERFGRLNDPLRVLLCSDVASEGLNLHYFCHRLVHFDLPWSLMVFQQRNGRVDRYGQTRQPRILYLLTETRNTTLQGDLRILEILMQKDDQAQQNLDDPSAFLNVYNADKEVEKVSDFMARGISPAAVDAQLEASVRQTVRSEGDYLMQLFGNPAGAAPDAVAVPARTSSLAAITEALSLFQDDYAYTKAAFALLEQQATLGQCTADDATQTVTITAPLDLQERLRQLPIEVQRSNHNYALCASAPRVMAALEQARQAQAGGDTWPQVHYLWPQHPILEWLGERILMLFGRHRAPLLQSPRLQPGEHAYLLMGLIPNRKGQPLLIDWQVASRTACGELRLEAYPSFANRAGLQAGQLPNPGPSAARDQALAVLQRSLPQAVTLMRAHMLARQADFAADLAQKLEGTLQNLHTLQSKQIEHMQQQLVGQLDTVRRSRMARRSEQIHHVFDEYRGWVRDTLTAEPKPWIQVMGAVCGPLPLQGA